MTYCQLRGIPAAMVVCYTDSSLSAFECASAFQPVLSHSAIADSLVLKVCVCVCVIGMCIYVYVISVCIYIIGVCIYM